VGDKRRDKTPAEEERDARERVVRQAEIALIQLNDEMTGKEPFHVRQEYLHKRRRIMLAANLTEEDLMQRPVFGAAKGGFAPDVDPTLTWNGLERHRSGEDRRDAIDRGEVTGKSLADALAEHLSAMGLPPIKKPTASRSPRAPVVVQTVEEKLEELDVQEAQGAITPVQHEVRAHEIRNGKRWSIEQRGRIETKLGALFHLWEMGEVDNEQYSRERAEVLQ